MRLNDCQPAKAQAFTRKIREDPLEYVQQPKRKTVPNLIVLEMVRTINKLEHGSVLYTRITENQGTSAEAGLYAYNHNLTHTSEE
jgi:hypothetical protein